MKQKIAMEMNISETAFVLPMEKTDQNPFKNGAKFELRWFTPTTEVPLCGHATLASAATLFYTQFNDNVSKTIITLLKFSKIDKINNIARYNLIDTKYRQMAFRSAI